jgi:hypothetical protein
VISARSASTRTLPSQTSATSNKVVLVPMSMVARRTAYLDSAGTGPQDGFLAPPL